MMIRFLLHADILVVEKKQDNRSSKTLFIKSQTTSFIKCSICKEVLRTSAAFAVFSLRGKKAVISFGVEWYSALLITLDLRDALSSVNLALSLASMTFHTPLCQQAALHKRFVFS